MMKYGIVFFHGKLTQNQVDGMEAILDFWESPPIEPTGEFKVNWDILPALD